MTTLITVDRRKQILSAVKQFGGKYIKDLDRSCTHLIIAKPASESKSSEKVKFVLNELRERDLSRRRGKKVTGHDIRICYEEWIWDCVGFNGRFKEDDYDARKPRKGGKVKAEDVINGTIFLEDGEVVKKEIVKEEEGPAVLRKRKREDIDSLVGDLISTTVAKIEIGDGTPTRPSGRGTASNELRKASLLHATRTASFGPVKSNDGPTPSMPATAPQPPTAELLRGQSAVQIFAGLRIGHLIEEAYEGLERALAAHGGTFVTEEQRLQGAQVDYVVVRL
jgi:DNA replication regulator DPB11